MVLKFEEWNIYTAPSAALQQLSVCSMSEGVSGEMVQSFIYACFPSSSQLADGWHHTHHPGRSCVGRSSIAPGVINGSVSMCFTQSAVQGSRTTAGQQENASWRLHHLHSWKNGITEAAALREPFIPAASFVRSDLCSHFKRAECLLHYYECSGVSAATKAGVSLHRPRNIATHTQYDL